MNYRYVARSIGYKSLTVDGPNVHRNKKFLISVVFFIDEVIYRLRNVFALCHGGIVVFGDNKNQQFLWALVLDHAEERDDGTSEADCLSMCSCRSYKPT